MPENNIRNYKITLVGTGNIAWHLGHAFVKNGIKINSVIGRSKSSARELGRQINSTYSTEFGPVDDNTEIIILCISDSAVGQVTGLFRESTGYLFHTAGSVGTEVFIPRKERCGVIYPFQTLTKNIPTDLRNVPFCIEASDSDTKNILNALAGIISDNIHFLSSEERKKLHLAGVIANNFSNHLFALAFDYLNKNKIDTRLILPLITETVRKIENNTPKDSQTGPSRRNNKDIIKEHLAMLESEPSLKKLYSIISESIIAYYSD
ncbi:MAG: DUF2520 domain-containing protein [Bacteroidales bacterium]|nr:DUF2520 domain-containing protein [Bacteroidales bacterium]